MQKRRIFEWFNRPRGYVESWAIVGAITALTWTTNYFLISYFEDILAFGQHRLIRVAVLIVVALFLFLFKRRYQALYGTSEFVFGAVSCWLVLEKTETPVAQLLALLGFVYVMTRGMGNIADGLKREPLSFTLFPALKRLRGERPA